MKYTMHVVSVTFLFFFTAAVVVNAQAPTQLPLECGAIVEGEVTADAPVAEYVIVTNAGTRVNLSVEPLGDRFNIFLALLDSGRSQELLQNNTLAGESEELIDYAISSTNSVLQVMGTAPEYPYLSDGWHVPGRHAGTHFGAYSIALDCTLRDGTRIPAGSTAPEPVTITQSFSGFGFPGLAPVDFSAGIEIPLSLDQPQTVPIASDIALYTYTASASESRLMTVSRLSGDISIGVTVINQDTNAIIFLGGMPFSESLTATLNFPTDGTYAIGLFRLDTAERSGTSGAVQVMIE